MDSLITAAALSLASGDPLGALNRVALRDDPPALALRGIAMAQLGDLPRAKSLLRRAARSFGPPEVVARARCVLAEAEIALVSRDLAWPGKALESARITLETHGDRANAAHARYLEVRHLFLIGHLDQAERALPQLDNAPLPLASRAAFELVVAGIAARRIHGKQARSALARAAYAARHAGIPALMAEIERAIRELEAPVARMRKAGVEYALPLADVEALLASDAWIVDGCRHVVRCQGTVVSLERRPVLFAIAHALAEAWPEDLPRHALVERVFHTRHADESHRARLRVEVGRLRRALRPLASVLATTRGFVLAPHDATHVSVLTRPVDEKHAAVLALLADGESWSSSALALALALSQRSVQRALDTLGEEGKVQSIGRGRSRRWMTPPITGVPTTLLLPSVLAAD
jgi:hypothetical protein